MTERVITHTLYRFFDKDGVLLYVGRTVSPSRRWREHEKSKSWFEDVATVTREVFATAAEVDAAERKAIANEHPLHNVMLNGVRRPKTKPVFSVDNISDSLATRWAAITESSPDERGVLHVDLHLVCEGSDFETVCECNDCHNLRIQEIENLREEYAWHPLIVANVNEVERSYLAGHDLSDWYYDLSDIRLFWRMHLVAESQRRPIPALTSLEESVGIVGCPFCLDVHRHFLVSGTALDAPITAGCQDFAGGKYVLVEDWETFIVGLERWAEHESVAA